MTDAGIHDAGPSDQRSAAAFSEHRLSAETVRELHDRYAPELRAFLIGLLRDSHLACDALQETFQRVLESGHTAQIETFKGWLFKVAFHEAMGIKRREAARGRVIESYRKGFENNQRQAGLISDSDPASSGLMREEEKARVQQALQLLPPEQRDVVQRRIYQEQTFAAIAEELNVPLGTVLTRMRLACEKLRQALGH